MPQLYKRLYERVLDRVFEVGGEFASVVSGALSAALGWLALTADSTTYEMELQDTGTGTPSITRSTDSYALDADGVYRLVDGGDAVWQEARVVTNIHTDPDNPIGYWSPALSAVINGTDSVTGPYGQTIDALDVSLDSGSGLSGITKTLSTTAGHKYWHSVWVKAQSGSGNIRVGIGPSYSSDIAIDTTWKRVAHYYDEGSTTTRAFSFRNGTTPTNIDIHLWHATAEDADGRPDETFPYEAVGKQGYFGSGIPANTVASNVVTEAAGTAYDPPPKMLVAPALTNYCLSSNNLGTASWASLASPIVAFTATGLTGEPNTASTIEDDGEFALDGKYSVNHRRRWRICFRR